MLNSSVRLEIGSGRSGNGLRCLEPGQKFRIFNSDHFTFLKNLNPTSGSRVSLAGKKTPHEPNTIEIFQQILFEPFLQILL